MGDPRKSKKKYETPNHPWERARIEEEKGIVKTFGFRRKKEIWKMQSQLRKIKQQAKDLIRRTDENAKKQQEVLMNRLVKMGLFEKPVELEKILDLPSEAIFKRRLQTIVYEKGFAHSPKQARQFITHGHITINSKVVNVPSYIVKKEEEEKISFKESSPLQSPDHPERKSKEDKKEITKAPEQPQNPAEVVAPQRNEQL
ncbi:MAG: 30S ribosomal protein S4 [Nanoarchaeota archaeon]